MSRPVVTATCLLVLAVIASVAPAAANAATPEKTDVMFVFDTSGSMSGVLGEAKEEIETVISRISASVPNVAFGVANVEDYPSYDEGVLAETKTEQEYEEDLEKPWRLDQSVTTEQSKVATAIEALSGSTVAHGGGDAPEAYGRALWETDTNPQVGWRSGARHEIILIADEVPHTLNVNEGLPEELWLANPFDTSEEQPGKWGIPGTVWEPGDNIEFQADLRQLTLDGKPLEMVDYHDTSGDYIHYWERWAGETGGQALEAKENEKESNELSNRLITQIEAGTTATLPACPAGESRNENEVCVVATTTATAQPVSRCVLPEPLPVSAVYTLSVIGGQEFQVPLYTGNGGNFSPSNLNAAIEWGDGTVGSATVTGSTGHITIVGQHTYPVPSARKEYRVTTRIYYAPPGCPQPSTPASTTNSPAYVVPPAVSHGSKAFNIFKTVGGTIVGGAACGVGLLGEPLSFGVDTGLTVAGCGFTALTVGDSVSAIQDPPDPHYQSVFRPSAVPVPRLHRSCKRLTRIRCLRLASTERRYALAAAKVAEISEAVGVTANRFGGAVAANDVAAEELQRQAEVKYLPMQVTAIKLQQKVARLLGVELTRDRLNVVISAKQVAQGRIAFAKLHGVPKRLISRLERDGIITSRAELENDIWTYLKKAPPPRRTTLATILGA